jgi:hypothetical protein
MPSRQIHPYCRPSASFGTTPSTPWTLPTGDEVHGGCNCYNHDRGHVHDRCRTRNHNDDADDDDDCGCTDSTNSCGENHHRPSDSPWTASVEIHRGRCHLPSWTALVGSTRPVIPSTCSDRLPSCRPSPLHLRDPWPMMILDGAAALGNYQYMPTVKTLLHFVERDVIDGVCGCLVSKLFSNERRAASTVD